MTDKERMVCIYVLQQQIKCDLEREDIEAVGVELPTDLAPNLHEVALFLCGIPRETWNDETRSGKCFDYLFDRWFDLVNEDSSTAPDKWITFLLEEAMVLQSTGHGPRQLIEG